jgi:3-deoxy-D-manno-octulosonate 8-phosphate phosphatase KdsC-like HAD superfamily phosphatase
MSLETAGGMGCVREFVEAILRARGDWDRVTEAFRSA